MQLVRKVKHLDEVAYRGKNALRVLMAADTPSIDLLVRESVQNSLDASVDSGKSVTVEFKYAPFDAQKLRGILDDETVDGLERIHPGTSTSLYVRDLGTKGLSGPKLHRDLSQGDAEGNYLKLCFAMGAAQEREDAGGSWGFGKTVFFRACHAPVMFYSRFRDGDGYAERLLFYLIEDADLPDSLTRSPQPPASTGFAWWGAKMDRDSIQPCEDSDQISLILNQLGGIPRYINDETGTLIFMPCLRKERQMPVMIPGEPSPSWIPRNLPPTIEEFEEYTNVAIQRWYAPRISNPTFARNKPYLIANIGDHKVGGDRYPFLPLAEIMRMLYDCGNGCKDATFMSQRGVELFDINLKSEFSDQTSAGKLAAIRIPLGDPILKMGPPYNHWAPLVQAGAYNSHDISQPPPMLAMTRSPGMIVAYENWMDTIRPDPEGSFLIGLFILRGAAIMREKYSNRTLEEEIRQNEPPAHNRWESGQGIDGEPFNLVEKIRSGIKKAIVGKFYPEKPAAPIERDSSLASVIGDRLLPAGFGDGPELPPIKEVWTCPIHPEVKLRAPGSCPVCNARLLPYERPIPLRGKEPQISILNQRFLPNNIIEIEILLYNGQAEIVEFSLNIASEGAHISPREWENEIQNRFPAELIEGRIYEFKRGMGTGRQVSWNPKDLPINPPAGGGWSYMTFSISPFKSRIKCRLRIQMHSPEAIPVLIAKQVDPMGGNSNGINAPSVLSDADIGLSFHRGGGAPSQWKNPIPPPPQTEPHLYDKLLKLMGLQKGEVPKIVDDPNLLPRQIAKNIWDITVMSGRDNKILTEQERKTLHDIVEGLVDSPNLGGNGGLVVDTLGTYDSANRLVTLYTRAIELYSRIMGVPYKNLYLVVLSHELSHAGNHLGVDTRGLIWDQFPQATTEIKEFFAQIYPHHHWKNEGLTTLVDLMRDMAQTQSPKYGEYLKHVNRPVDVINDELLQAR